MEKQLGITDKRQIEEEVGIAEFVRLCRESVRNYVGEWKKLTERIGYWIDIDDAYWTFTPDYIESVWWQLKEIWNQGLLYEDIKVVPYCPRCGTALSSHELGQPDVYRVVVDQSAFVRFPLLDEGVAAGPLAARWVGHGRRALVGGLDDNALDPPVQHRSGRRSRAGVQRGRRHDRGLGFGGVGLRRGRPGQRHPHRRDLVGLHYQRPFDDLAGHPGAPARAGGWWPGTSSRPTRGPGSSIWPRPSARSTGRSAGRKDCPPSTRWGPTGGSPTPSPGSPASRCATPTRTINDRLERGRAVGAACTLRALLPTLLAVRHRTHLLGQAQLVRQDLGAEGRAGGREPDHRLAPRAHPGRPDGGVAGQQRRLGPVPRPLLGDAAPRSGGVPKVTSGASPPGPSCPSWPAGTSPTSIPTGPAIDEVIFP